MRTLFACLLALVAGCQSQNPEPAEAGDVNVDVHIYVPGDTDESEPEPVVEPEVEPEYDGQRAVLEGYMISSGSVRTEVSTAVDELKLGDYRFELTSFDGDARNAHVQPTKFVFWTDSDGDGVFGETFDREAEDFIDACYLVLRDPVSGDMTRFGLAEVANVTGRELDVTGVWSIPVESGPAGTEFGVRCSFYRFEELTGTKVGVSMHYSVVHDADVWDASTARLDNVGGGQWYHQLGPESCSRYWLTGSSGVSRMTCSMPVLEAVTPFQYAATTSGFAPVFSFSSIEGKGNGYDVNSVQMNVTFPNRDDITLPQYQRLSGIDPSGNWYTIEFRAYGGGCDEASCTTAYTPAATPRPIEAPNPGITTVIAEVEVFGLTGGDSLEVRLGAHEWTDLATQRTFQDAIWSVAHYNMVD
jgi:hypothetical protein